MTEAPQMSAAPNSIRIRVGDWFEAQATGWGVGVVPVVLFGLLFALGLSQQGLP